jgi:hypothetical protein
MKTASRLTIAAAVAAAVQGCAGSGGGGDQDVIGDTLPELLLCAPLGICGARASAVPQTSASVGTSEPPPPVPFTQWTDHLGQLSTVEATGPQSVTGYEYATDGSIRPAAGSTFEPDGSVALRYDLDDYVQKFETRGATLHYGKPLEGHAGVEVAGDNDAYRPSIGLVANPYALGWNYQSFGAWNGPDVVGIYRRSIGAVSFGAASPVDAVPTVGAAKFTGKLGGLYVSPTGQGSLAAADVTVDANFAARSMSFSSTGTTIRGLASLPTPSTKAAPELNISGTLTYAPGTNAFSGTLTNAGGTMSGASNGRFYGPAAQELGGVFTVKSTTTVETFAGAYGAKR